MKNMTLVTTHDNLKVGAGWYKPDWKGDTEVKAKNPQAQVNQSLGWAGIRYATDFLKLSGPVGHETVPGLVYGAFHDNEVPEHLRGQLTYESSYPSKDLFRKRGLTTD